MKADNLCDAGIDPLHGRRKPAYALTRWQERHNVGWPSRAREHGIALWWMMPQRTKPLTHAAIGAKQSHG
jgi:hypothetical protein